MNNNFINKLSGSVNGYDNLMTFKDVYPDLETFINQVENYVWFEDIKSEANEKITVKYFNQIYNRYKNSYFRYDSLANINQKTAKFYEEFLRWNGAVDQLVKVKPSDEEITEYFNTDNTNDDLEIQQIFRREVEKLTTTTWKDKSEQQTLSLIKINMFEGLIARFGRKMFMSKRKIINEKELVGGR